MHSCAVWSFGSCFLSLRLPAAAQVSVHVILGPWLVPTPATRGLQILVRVWSGQLIARGEFLCLYSRPVAGSLGQFFVYRLQCYILVYIFFVKTSISFSVLLLRFRGFLEPKGFISSTILYTYFYIFFCLLSKNFFTLLMSG